MKYGKQFWVNRLGEDWALELKEILCSPYAEKLMDYIVTEYALQKVNPEKKILFNAFKLCPWSSLKVVIVGNEPHEFLPSSGLTFGDNCTSQFHNSSVTTIFDCIQREYYPDNLFPDFDFSLEDWATQGVLLLNRSLSVRENFPGAHKRPWGKFVSAVLNSINEHKENIVFMLWGKEAQQLIRYIHKKHYILTFDAPGEYADKKEKWSCPNFQEANKILMKLYSQTIKW